MFFQRGNKYSTTIILQRSNMKITNENIRSIVEDYVDHIMHDMSWSELRELTFTYIYNEKLNMDKKELRKEILEYCPSLLED